MDGAVQRLFSGSTCLQIAFPRIATGNPGICLTSLVAVFLEMRDATSSTRASCVLPTCDRLKSHKTVINPLPPSDAVRKQKEKLQDLFSSVLSKNLKYITPLET